MFIRQPNYRGLLLCGIAFGVALAGKGQAPSALSLDEAINAGLQHHPHVAAAEASEDKARAALLRAKVAQRPTLTVDEDVTYSNDPVFAFGSKLRQGRFGSSDFALPSLNHPSALANSSASATAAWTAFDAGSTHRGIESARSSLTATQLSTQYTREELGVEITKLYYRVLLAEDQIIVAEASLKRAKELSSDLQDRAHSGLSLESDSMRSSLAQRTAEDELAAAQNNVGLARRDLFDTIGEPESNRPLVRPDVEKLPSGEHSNPEQHAIVSRLDLQAIRQQESAATLARASAKAAAWPRLSTYAHVENDAQDVVTNGSGNWTIGAKLELPLFDGGARKAREREADAQLHALQAQEHSTLLSARSTIASLQSQIDDLKRRYSTAQDAIRVQQEALQTARDRYASGLVSISEVLSGESDLSSAEYTRIRIAYQLRIANADLAFAEGSSLTSKAGQP